MLALHRMVTVAISLTSQPYIYDLLKQFINTLHWLIEMVSAHIYTLYDVNSKIHY